MRPRDHWIISAHAEERCAERFGLILDPRVRAMVSNQINLGNALLISRKGVRYGSCIYEISILGRRVIAICNPEEKVIVTLIDAKEWYRSVEIKRRRSRPWKAGTDEEE